MRVYIVFQRWLHDEPQIDSIYDNIDAAEACVDAGVAAGVDRWLEHVHVDSRYVPEEDGVVEIESQMGEV